MKINIVFFSKFLKDKEINWEIERLEKERKNNFSIFGYWILQALFIISKTSAL